LAAGESKRYGSNKLLSVYRGKPLIEHILNLVKKNFLNKVIVLGKYKEEIEKNVDLRNFIIVHNKNYFEGLSSSLKEGIKKSITPWTMIFLADMPEIQKEFIDILINKKSTEFLAYYLTYKNQKGFPVLINERLYDRISEIYGDKGLRTILKDKTLAYSIEINDSRCLFDIDKRELK
jgi:molybdenum cofactor cytidylyltransferase